MFQLIQPIPDTTAIFGKAVPDHHSLADFRTFHYMRMSLHSRAASNIGHTDFIYQLTLHLPEVATLIDESDFGILHLEIGTLTSATKEAINRFDFQTLRRHFGFISKLFERADMELKNAIQISYLENLLLGEASPAHAEARYRLPKALDNALKKSEMYFEGLSAS